ncbi:MULTISPECIES: hypothetical protein [unclassified Chryseobacterium]|uniref:hypothetical protein n=1 Tax=unclassified Chryseobacterium TaxID=2593645 RepID=UPI00226A3EEA|nr:MULTISPECIES: hypothetical protein [unclassified Chryseobacterium]
MKFKLLLLFIFSFSFLAQVEAQRRTTSVRGYTRKDGTYVRPHTRSYNSGSGYSSSYSSSPTSNINYLNSSINSSKEEYTPSETFQEEGIQNSKLSVTEDKNSGTKIYLSVLYYNDKIIDICPITKSYQDWDFNRVYHSFNKSLITAEDTLELITNYNWTVRGENVTKNFEYEYSKKGNPKFLKKKIEVLYIK